MIRFTWQNALALVFLIGFSGGCIGLLSSALTRDILAVGVEDKDSVTGPLYSLAFYRTTHILVQNGYVVDDTLSSEYTIDYDECVADWCADVQAAAAKCHSLNIAALVFLLITLALFVGLFLTRRLHHARALAALLLLPFCLALAAPSAWFSHGFSSIPDDIPTRNAPPYYDETSRVVTVYPGVSPILLYVAALIHAILFCCVFCWYSCLLTLNPANPAASAAPDSFALASAPAASPHVVATQPQPQPQHVMQPLAPQYAPQQYAPQQYAPQQYPPQQYAPQQYAPQQYPPQQYAPQQYPPAPNQGYQPYPAAPAYN